MQGKRVAAAIIVVLAVGYVIGLWSLLGEWLGALWYLLAASTLVPNWLLGIFAMCAIIIAGMLGASLRPTRQAAPPAQVHAQDTFFNIKWRWSYDEQARVQKPTPYCLRCDHPLVMKNVGSYGSVDRYECRCDHCGALACEIDCSLEEFERRVLQRIDQASPG